MDLFYTRQRPSLYLRTRVLFRQATDGDLGCASYVAGDVGAGMTAAVGASLLARYGARRVVHAVGGGVQTWARAGGVLATSG